MPLILACSGGSNVGQITNQAALELTREGRGRMFCLAGLGADIPGIIKTVREAGETGEVIVLDGCPIGCAKGIMERSGLPFGRALVVTDLGIEKVLGSGQVTHALRLTAVSYSAQAKDKIEAAGGQALTV